MNITSLPFRLIIWLLLLNGAAFAQTQTTGAIQGKVYEQGTTTPIASVVVTVTNQETGLLRSALTNAEGTYFIAMLPPGYYTLEGKLDGYELVPDPETSNFPIKLAKNNLVQPPPLTLRRLGAAGVSSTVAPAASGALATTNIATGGVQQASSQVERLVNTVNATRGANFSKDYLWALPLANIRSFDDLALLAAGVAPPPQTIGNTVGPGVGPGVGTSGQFAVNGLRSRANNFTIDGSDNNDEDIGVRRQGFLSLIPQTIESVQEYQIFTLLPEPQFGRNLGAQANAVSRAGGRGYHGMVYGFLTDRRLRAREFFDLADGPANFPITRASDGAQVLLDRRPLAPANPVGGENSFTRAQTGGVFGGPLGGNETNQPTHFFLSFEHQNINASREAHFAVPTVAERGIFGTGERGFVLPRASQTSQLFYPTSLTGDAYFSLFPFPNNPRGPYGTNTYTEILPASADGSVFSAKIDHNLKLWRRDHIFTGRYNFTDDNTILPVTGEALFSSLRALVRAQNLSLFFDSAINNQMANQVRVSYGRTRLNFAEVRNPFLRPSTLLPNERFLLNAPLLANATLPRLQDGQIVFPAPSYQTEFRNTENIIGPVGQVFVSSFSPLGVNVFNFPQARVNNTFQYADTLIYNLTKHRLTLGADFRRTQLNSRLDRNFRAQVSFSGAADVAERLGLQFRNFSPNGFYNGADFVAVGAPTGLFQSLSLTPDSTIGLRFWQENFFFADQIRVRPNFTLTLGLRYEYNTVPGEANERIERTFGSQEVRDFIAAEKELTDGVSGFERFLAGRTQIFAPDKNNFAPHLAFAWDIFGTGLTALRGGYGVYYDQIPGAVISQSRTVFPTFLNLNLAGLVHPADRQSLNFNSYNPATQPLQLITPGSLNTASSAFLARGPVVLLRALTNLTPNVQGLPQAFPGGPGFVLPAADLDTSYSQQWTLTFEQQLARDFLLSAGYVGTRGVHLLRFATPNYGLNTIPVPINASPRFQGSPEPVFQGFSVAPGPGFRRTFPFLGSFTAIESDASSTYHALQLQLNKRLTNGLQFTTAYTWSHVIDEVSDLFDLAGTRTLPQNSLNRRGERGDANFDLRHRFVSSFIWDLPLFAKHNLLGGWQLAGITTFQTGQTFTFISAFDANLDGNLTDRLSSTTGISRINQGATIYQFPANQSALVVVGRDGTVGRNTFRTPGLANVDLAVNKFFRFSEQRNLTLRTEFFNLFNRAHFGIPVAQLGAPSLGRAVETRLTALLVQLALKYSF